MSSLSARLAGLAAAFGLVGLIAILMILWDSWDWQALAFATLLSLPLYVVTRDGAEHRRPAASSWVPPWERTNAGSRARP